MTDSSESSELEAPRRKVLRYHKLIDATYKPHDVTSRTRKHWDIEFGKNSKNDSTHLHYKSCCTSSISLNYVNTESDGCSVEENTANLQVSEGRQLQVDDLSSESLHEKYFYDKLDILPEDSNDENYEEYVSDSSIGFDSSYDETGTDESNVEHEIDENLVGSDILNEIMFESSKLSVRDVIVMITAFSTRFHLSYEAQSELINLLKICSGPQSVNFNLTKYTMLKYFSFLDKNIARHYYCNKCCEKVVYSVNSTDKSNKGSCGTVPPRF